MLARLVRIIAYIGTQQRNLTVFRKNRDIHALLTPYTEDTEAWCGKVTGQSITIPR